MEKERVALRLIFCSSIVGSLVHTLQGLGHKGQAYVSNRIIHGLQGITTMTESRSHTRWSNPRLVQAIH